MANVHLHLLIVGFILLVPTPQQAQGNVSCFSPTLDRQQAPIVPIDFDVETGDYNKFLLDLHGKLATQRKVKGVPVLAEQSGEDDFPAKWIHVNFVRRVDAAVYKTTIAIRNDNIYIVGFTNNTGNWFTFKGYQRLIPGSTRLPFKGSYTELVGGHAQLTDIKLGKENMLEAVLKLARHRRHHPDGSLRLLRKALAKLCVMVAEAERFRPINVKLVQGWEDTPQINAFQAEYVGLWSKMSYALLMWQKTKDWTDKGNELRKVGIDSEDKASSILGLLLWPKKFTFSFDADDDAGKPLANDTSTTCSCN